MNALRENYFEALKAAQRLERPRKQLVSKSALGPQIVTVHDSSGVVMGFGPVERVPPDVVQAELRKEEIAKGADLDPNAIFDDSPLMPDFQSSGVQDIAKSAELDDEYPELIGIFPPFLR
ncbi:MAG: hypothetical protein WDZ51_03470 [Pirellulaceae bacterium]